MTGANRARRPDRTPGGAPDGGGACPAADGTSGRGRIPGLISPHPIMDALPGIYLEHDFTRRFTSAFDELLAPVYATLDNLDSYLDPALAPPDFLTWLGTWAGLADTYAAGIAERRALVARAALLHRIQGTPGCVRELIRLGTGLTPELIESGGTHWSRRPGGPPPGNPRGLLVVRLRVPPDRTVEYRQVDALVRAAKPAHVPHRIEIEVLR